jgi:hypothetical protein
MSFVATAIAGSAVIGAGAAIYGASQQSQAIQNASQNVLQGQQQAIGAINKLETPFVNFSQGLQPTLQSLLTPGPNQNQAFQSLPGAQFASQMADYGISAGAGKTGISGSTAVAGGTLKSQLAGQQFSTLTNPLVQLYGTGAQAAGNAGNQISNTITGGAQSQAQLALGQGNVLAGAAGGVGNNLSNALLFNALRGGGFGSDWQQTQQVANANPSLPPGTSLLPQQ